MKQCTAGVATSAGQPDHGVMDEQRLRGGGEPEPYAYRQDPETGMWHVVRRGDQTTLCGLADWQSWNSSGMAAPPRAEVCSLCNDALRQMRASGDIPEL